MHRSSLSLALVACSLFELGSHDAHAEVSNTIVAVDGEAVIPTDEPIEQDVEPGWGGRLRAGPRLDLTVVTLTSELTGSINQFEGTLAPTLYRGTVGARLGLLTLLRPELFGHLGVGHVDYRANTQRGDLTNLTGDLGVGLDFTLLPLIDVGAHGAYNFVARSSSEPGFSWLSAGLHVAFVL